MAGQGGRAWPNSDYAWRAEKLGHGLVLLVGDLSYYGQSGFVIAPSGLICPGPVDESRLLIYEIKRGIAADLSGSVSVAS